MGKHASSPMKFFKILHSKNSLSHLFIFSISLSIGFICAFFFQNVSTSLQTFVFYVLHSLSLSQISPTLSQSISPTVSLLSEPPSPPLFAESIPSPPPDLLAPSPLPPLAPPPDLLAPSPPPLAQPPSPQPPPPPPVVLLAQPPPPPPPPPPVLLAHGDTLSLSPSPQPQPQPSSLSPSPSPSPQPQPPLAPPSLSLPTSVSINEQQIPRMHNMSDEDLVESVMRISSMNSTKAKSSPYNKVAFMFLTPGPLPLSPLWELFFKGHNDLFSIYVHPHPSYNDTIPEDSVFYGTRITSQAVYWGGISMVDAERRLLANALVDPSNQRFVLLSDSCIPLFNFTTIYNYLVNSNLSYIASFDDKRKSGRGRYNAQMSPNITIQDWRKGSQWFEVNRDLALRIISDQKFYRLFKEYCQPPCYSDEHYLPTMVNILYEDINSNRTITNVDWSIAGPHPRKYLGRDITAELLNSIRFGSTECIYNGNVTPMCMLFARKFTPGTINPLINFAPLIFGSNT